MPNANWTIKALGATKDGGRLYRYSQSKANNVALVDDIQPGSNFRVVSAQVSYSAAPTQAGVQIVLESGAGAAFNFPLLTGAANGQYTTYPSETAGEAASGAGPLFGSDDKVQVNAPAGGAAVSVAASIYIEVL